MIVGYLNGDVRIFRVDQKIGNDISQVKLQLVNEIKTDLQKITALHCQPSADNGRQLILMNYALQLRAKSVSGLLLIGDVKGRAAVITLTQIETGVELSNLTFLWETVDNIKIEFFRVLIYEKCVFVCVAKGSFLLIFMLNQSGKVLDRYAFQAENYFITGEYYSTEYPMS